MMKEILLQLRTQLTLFFMVAMAATIFAQEAGTSSKKFTNSDKQFRDWSIGVFGGMNLVQAADFVSWDKGRFEPGYDFQAVITKDISHLFSLALQFNLGETSQAREDLYQAQTEYMMLSLLGDINLISVMRRSDNQSPYRWGLHAYGGIGIMSYDAYRSQGGGEMLLIDSFSLADKSFFFQAGAGLRFKINDNFDAEFKGMYVFTGDEEFDGSGRPPFGAGGASGPWDFEEGRDDSFFTFSLGLHYNLKLHKKQKEALHWALPMQPNDDLDKILAELNNKIDELDSLKQDYLNDDDKDGVFNIVDKCPDTPEGETVDGAGCVIDYDGDGLRGSEDECPYKAGPESRKGCPEEIKVDPEDLVKLLTLKLKDIRFAFGSANLREISFDKLIEAAEIVKEYPGLKLKVVGHTDAAGDETRNLELSRKRAQSVVNFLVAKGVKPEQLTAEGRGEFELKYPECNPASNCPDWKNLENRRVEFENNGTKLEDLQVEIKN